MTRAQGSTYLIEFLQVADSRPDDQASSMEVEKDPDLMDQVSLLVDPSRDYILLIHALPQIDPYLNNSREGGD